MPIEQIRTVLFIALLMVLFLMWQAWQKDYAPAPIPAPAVTGAPPTRPDVPDAPETPDLPAVPVAAGDTPVAVAPAESTAGIVLVETDVLKVELDPVGGTIRRVELLKYPVAVESPDEPFLLLRNAEPNFFIAQSGLLGKDAAPNHHAKFQVEKTSYVLAEGSDSLSVHMRWRSPSGVAITKTYTFGRDSYLIQVANHIENQSAKPWSASMYAQLQRSPAPTKKGFGFIRTYTGGVLSSSEKPYEKIDFSDMTEKDIDRSLKGGWAAMIQHYFLAAVIPGETELNHYYTKALDTGRYVIGIISPAINVAAGANAQTAMKIYVGPKDQDRLDHAADRLRLTVDFGWLTIIAEPLFWLLRFIHGVLHNWGWSIIVLTLLIKLAFFKLSAASYNSMAKMRKLQPRMVTLRERFGSDKAKLNQAMMEMYKKEKINPLGGCLPILVQIPVFIALYWVLLESIELRQASFIFWLNDLSTYDPYFVLPIAMGITMLLQQRLNPTPPDPIQAKVMMALPFVFTFFFLFFPSGLVLYWFVNNCLSIAQQWVITKRIVGTTA